jgi:hypothetical protein
MNPLIVSAQYAAYVWYLNKQVSVKEEFEEARRFARTSWATFLPVANEGWGRLLQQIANGKENRKGRARRSMKQPA